MYDTLLVRQAIERLLCLQYLIDRVSFLSFIDSIPPVILGVVTGLLPVL